MRSELTSMVISFPLFLPVRTFVVDEERESRKQLRFLVERTDDIEVIGEFESTLEALHAIRSEAPDLVLLDVKLPELSGLAMLEALEPERCPEVVFITPAHAKNLQRAFELHGLNYLRKPVTDERFYDVLRRACRRVLQERLGHANATHARDLTVLRELRGRSQDVHDRLVIQDKAADTYHVIRSHDIDWIQAKNRGVLIHVGTQPYFSRQGLTEVERQLDPGVFMRIHRSRIVNRARIIAVKRLWKGEYSVLLRSGKSLGRACAGNPRRLLCAQGE